MNWSQRCYGQGKLTWKISPTMKLNTNYIYDNTKSTPYNHRNYFYNPDGVGNDLNTSHTVILQFTHTLSSVDVLHDRRDRGSSVMQATTSTISTTTPDPYGTGDLLQVGSPAARSYVHPKLFLTPMTRTASLPAGRT